MPDFAQLMRSEGAAVVSVSIAQRVPSWEAPEAPSEGEDDELRDSLRRFFEPDEPRRFEGLFGSGFIVSQDGYIITSAHLAMSPAPGAIVVRLADRREFDARVVGFDLDSDIALLKIAAPGLQPVRIGNPDRLQVGDWVAAIGSPFGFDRSLTAGIVSAKGRTLPEDALVPFIQTDVAMNPGNSGGPLFNLRGEVVAVNSVAYSETGGYTGVSFAIPIDFALDVARQLKAQGKVTRGALGLRVQEVTSALARAFGLPRPAGALVGDVYKGGPAGLRPGDVIVRFDGRAVETSADFLRLTAGALPGTTVQLELIRRGARVAANAAIEEQGAFRQPARRAADAGRVDRSGLLLGEIAALERERLGLDGGVLVKRAEGGAQQAGLRRGDVILSVNGEDVGSPERFYAQMAKVSKSGYAALRIQRGAVRLFVPLANP